MYRYIKKINEHVSCLDNDADFNAAVANGWVELTPDEITALGDDPHELGVAETSVDSAGNITVHAKYYLPDGTAGQSHVGNPVPAGAITTPRPDPEEYYPTHNGTTWQLHDDALSMRREELANLRWEKLAEGATVDGVLMHADRDSLNAMAGYMSEEIKKTITQVRWKCKDGVWRTYTLQEFSPVYAALKAHEKACFDHESDLSEDLETAGDTLLTVDITAGWPANVLTT